MTGAVYSLALVGRSFQGPPAEHSHPLADYGGRELSTMLALVAMLVWLGLNPQPVLALARPTVAALLGVMP